MYFIDADDGSDDDMDQENSGVTDEVEKRLVSAISLHYSIMFNLMNCILRRLPRGKSFIDAPNVVVFILMQMLEIHSEKHAFFFSSLCLY